MFSNKGLFKHIICPNGAACRMPNCIFSHEFLGANSAQDRQPSQPVPKPEASTNESTHDPKRRKLDGGATAPGRVSSETEKKAFVGSLVPERPAATGKNRAAKSDPRETIDSPAMHLRTAQQPVSPPARAGLRKNKSSPSVTKNASPAAKPKDAKKETLNPRSIPNNPVVYGMRVALLEKLHEMMVALNKQAGQSSDAELKALHLDDNALIKAALDEEERLARTQGKVYSNVIRLRIMAYKKMKVEEWKTYRLEVQAAEAGVVTKKEPPPLETGLTPGQETLFLSRLTANQEGLGQHGYVTAVPTDAEIQQAKEGVAAGAGWEVCDRCKTRFQVFPDRREDGALTSGSHCTFHWGKQIRPAYKKTDAITGRTEPRYTCCNEAVGTEGCTTLATHVFKVSEAKRLAAVLPFITTPPNPNPIKNKAVCFDCEMGYTVYGLELIRLTATTWPDGNPLMDVLVRPLGTILDLNTRFSGVTPEQFFSALDHNPDDPDSANPKPGEKVGKQTTLRIVSSPAEARSLLLSYIAPETPLLGHALENDLNAVRLVHPTIVDTVLLFPHVKGLPMRLGLKGLAKGLLHKDIQTAGAAGHDSLEDARATGELVRVKVAKEWRNLQSSGWTVRAEGFFPPPGSREADQPVSLQALSQAGMAAVGGSKKKKKRSRSQVDGVDDETDGTDDDWGGYKHMRQV